MFPVFEDFLYPFLYALKDGEITSKEMKSKMIDHFHLTDADCALMTKGGTKTQLNDRLNWCVWYFRRSLFVEIPKRGTYKITQRGVNYLKNHSSLSRNDLNAYPEFADLSNTSASTSTMVHSPQATPSLPFLTPTEQMEEAFNTMNSALSENLLSSIMEQSPTFFEHLVLRLLEAMGYGKGVVTQRTNDGGIDGYISEDKLGLETIHFQAKRLNSENKVGRPAIQSFVGALDGAGGNKGVFITTSGFTKDALECKSSKKVAKIDGKQLTNLMIQHNVGVETEYVYEVKRIDKDFFDED